MQGQKLLMKCTVLLFACCVSVVLFGSQLLDQNTLVAQQQQPTLDEKIKIAVESWKSEVSKDESFDVFVNASWDVQALGPGTKSYLVLFYGEAKHIDPIGYLILHITETGALKVGEFGKGLFHSFDSLGKSPLNSIYNNPFEFVYADNESQWIDAFTLEQLPLIGDVLNSNNKSYVLPLDEVLLPHATFHSALQRTFFSPYDKLPWLTSRPINEQLITDRSIETDIEFNSELYFRVKAWNNKISSVYAVTALQKWNDNFVFIGLQLDEDTIRYIPYDDLLDLGFFYSSS